MQLYDYSNDYQSLCICGDIHGEFKALVYNIKRLKIRDAVVIVAGDCGIGFEKPAFYEQMYNKIRRSLSDNNIVLLLVRGNHDDPAYFEEKLIDRSRMKTIPDYSVIRVAGREVLCVGGATSIDRRERLSYMWSQKLKRREVQPVYWENEAVVYSEDALSGLVAAGIKINTVVTHTAPSFCYPPTKGFFEHDEELFRDLRLERETMDLIYDKLRSDNHPVSDWLYGHFHSSNLEIISGIKFSMLNIDEIKELCDL